jgi:hypothetical protein
MIEHGRRLARALALALALAACTNKPAPVAPAVEATGSDAAVRSPVATAAPVIADAALADAAPPDAAPPVDPSCPATLTQTHELDEPDADSNPDVYWISEPGAGADVDRARIRVQWYVDLDNDGRRDLAANVAEMGGNAGDELMIVYVACGPGRYRAVWGPNYGVELRALSHCTRRGATCWRDLELMLPRSQDRRDHVEKLRYDGHVYK